MIDRFHAESDGIDIMAWVNALPGGAPRHERDDITAYCAKPYAFVEAARNADVVIWCDAAYVPIRHIRPLINHICGVGYYFCQNGYKVGQWVNDRMLGYFGLTRDDSFAIEEVSGSCIGLDMRKAVCCEFLREWVASVPVFPGPHTNTGVTEHDYRANRGFCSADSRCLGHRHDQSAASIIAVRLGMTNLGQRPYLTTYRGGENETTVLVNIGGGGL